MSDGRIDFSSIRISTAEFGRRRQGFVAAVRDGIETTDAAALSQVLLGSLALRGRRPLVVIGEPSVLSLPLASLPYQTKRLVDYADVVFASSVAAAVRPPARRAAFFDRPLVVGVNSTLSDGIRLSAAQTEADTVAQLLGVKALDSRRASGSTIAYLLERATIFHFAGHALTDTERPENARLILASVDGRPADLTAGQIAKLHLEGLQLAVLSACTTSIVDPGPGEPLGGLAMAFLSAGTRSVVATLWPVSDRGMALASQRIHASVREGMSIPAAVAEQLRLAEASGTGIADAASIIVYSSVSADLS